MTFYGSLAHLISGRQGHEREDGEEEEEEGKEEEEEGRGGVRRG